MAAVYALRNRERVSRVATFGAPYFMWVDSMELGNAYKEWPYSLDITNYVYKNDPVPRILGTPLTSSLIKRYVGTGVMASKLSKWVSEYKPLGRFVQLDHNGETHSGVNMDISQETALASVKDHSMSNYVRALCD